MGRAFLRKRELVNLRIRAGTLRGRRFSRLNGHGAGPRGRTLGVVAGAQGPPILCYENEPANTKDFGQIKTDERMEL